MKTSKNYKKTTELKYPYDELTDIEKERIEDFRSRYLADYKDIYVYYSTDFTIGIGYRIIVSLRPIKDIIDFNDTVKDITDYDIRYLEF